MKYLLILLSILLVTVCQLGATTPVVNGRHLSVRGHVIGRLDHELKDLRQAPPALLAWLEAANAQGTALPTGQRFTPVEPLLGQTAWNQEWPYNLLCPLYDGLQPSATGCVATAMAQVMYYYRWPEQGQGQHSYRASKLGTLSADFGQTRYDWDQMLPRYDSTASVASQQAVAQLMLHCGIAVDMTYGESSGANDTDVPPALTTYFGYNPDIHYRQRRHYTLTEWLTIIHEELLAGRPVLAYGASRSGAHAYVFDGMDADGMIHINWGWGGMSNGYFAPIDLTPPAQGTGGSASGYNMEQRIVTDIQPLRDPAQIRHSDLELIASSSPLPTTTSTPADAPFDLRITGSLTNGGWRDADFVMGLELTDSSGQLVRVVDTGFRRSLRQGEVWQDPLFTGIVIGPLPDGHYKARLVARNAQPADGWTPVRRDVTEFVSEVTLDVSSGHVTFGYDLPRHMQLAASFTQLPDTFYRKVPMRLEAKICNVGGLEYHDNVHVEAYDQKGTRVMLGANELIDVEPGDSLLLPLTYTFTLTPGTYTLQLLDTNHYPLSAPVPITMALTDRVVQPTSVAPLRVSLQPDGTWQSEAVVTADEGFSGGLLYTYVYDAQSDEWQGCLEPAYYFLKPGDLASVRMTGTMDNAVAGTTYRLQLVAYDGTRKNWLNDPGSTVTYTFSPDADAITAVHPDAHRHHLCFDLFGRKLPSSDSNLQPGMSIIAPFTFF